VAVAWARMRGMAHSDRIDVDPAAGTVRRPGNISSIAAIDWDVPTHGTVIGTLLNERSALAALGDAMHEAPYLAPPHSVILYIKPRNTWTACGAPVIVPAGVRDVEVGATLGIVIGATACRVDEARAFDVVAGYTVVNDISEPHASVYRPALRQRCRDGFCPIGPWIIAREEVTSPDALDVRVFINGKRCATQSTASLVRPVARLLAEVSQFMTLQPGDVLLAGIAGHLPRARAGDRIRVEIDRVGSLENLLVAEARP
jgi:5-oxopent-3-ene-1,2,5-tricarboxylate decarboxylase / 2-hydroxyhepta-2,4-diene-1,7-dioate isomerase